MKIIHSSKRRQYLAKVSIFVIMLTFIVGGGGFHYVGGYNTDPSQNLEIRTWYDLNAVRDNLAGNHTLMNDLNSTTPGYDELAGPTANGGKGWQPIGSFVISYSGPGCQAAMDVMDVGVGGWLDGHFRRARIRDT